MSSQSEVIRTLAAILRVDGIGEAVKLAGHPTIEELLGFMRENSIPVSG